MKRIILLKKAMQELFIYILIRRSPNINKFCAEALINNVSSI